MRIKQGNSLAIDYYNLLSIKLITTIMVEAESPTRISNDELVENCLILVQQLFAEELINDQERDHLKGNVI